MTPHLCRHASSGRAIFCFLVVAGLEGCGVPRPSSAPAFKESVETSGIDSKPTTVRKPSIDRTEIEFVVVPGGSARLGSPSNEPGRDSSLERMVTVRVDSFLMSRTEITNAQYFAFVEPRRSCSATVAEMPVTAITYKQAVQFCDILTRNTGVRHRLPTEAEWEYACRAGCRDMISSWQGATPIDDAISSFHRGDPGKLTRGLNASCNIATRRIQVVGKYRSNSFGLHDMHGNVAEWINVHNTITPPPSPVHTVIRGGSALSTNVFCCRAASRAWQHMDKAADSIGFRIIRESSR